MESNPKAGPSPLPPVAPADPYEATFWQNWRAQLSLVLQKPWLTAAWLKGSRTLLERFNRIYSHLCRQPRPVRRRLQRQLGATLAGTALALALANMPVQAADFVANDATTLVDAINAANDETTNPGADTITLTDDITLTTAVNPGDSLYFGLPAITSTITIEGAGFTLARDTNSEDQFGLFFVYDAGDLTLNDITITGGLSLAGAVFNVGTLTVNDSTLTGNTGLLGAAVLSKYGSTAIHGSTFTNNVGIKYGGALAFIGPTTITDSTISNNLAVVGGGIVNAYALTVTNSLITQNTAKYGNGGGILNINNGVVTLTGSTLSNNVAPGTESSGGWGGALYNNGGHVTITDSTISGNSSGFSGGGLFNYYAATPTVSSARGQGQAALPAAVADKLQALGIDGARMKAWETTLAKFKTQTAARLQTQAADTATMTLVNSTVSNNTAGTNTSTTRVNDDDGGGIVNKGGTLALTNSTVSGNQASNNADGFYGAGGGIYNTYDGTVTLYNSTLTGNDAGNNGGGIFNLGGLTLNRSLIAGNSASTGVNEIHNDVGCLTAAATDGTACLVSTNTVTADAFNLIGHSGESNAEAIYGFTPGASDITATSNGTTPTALANILNSTVADNGGPTLTHALVAGSPAIDAAGDSGLATDQRGVARPQGAADDIGALEVKVINGSVTQGTPTTSNNPTPQLCAATGTNLAIYTINSPMTNNSSNTFTDLFFRVKQLEYTTPQGGAVPSLCNATTVVNNGGVGSMLAVPNSSLPGGNSQFNPSEILTQAFQVGRPVAAQFRIKVDLFSSSAAAANTAGEAAEEQYLGSFEYVFDPTPTEVTPAEQIFLPLIIH